MNALKTGLLLSVLTVLLVLVGRIIGGPAGALMAFGFALVINVGAYWYSDKVVLRMYRASPITEAEAPGLYRVIRELAGRLRIPMPRLYRVPSATPNAFATGRSPRHAAVAVTDGILRLMGEEELKGVLAHELGHVQNRDTLVMSIAAAVAGAIAMLASWARWAMLFGAGGRNRQGGGAVQLIALLVVAIFAPLAAMLVQMAISRTREYGADTTGARTTGNPYGLADALEKLDAGVRARPMEGANPATAHLFIVNPLRADAIAKLFSTHPPIADRVRRLRAMRL